MGNHPSNHQPLERANVGGGGIGKFGDVNGVREPTRKSFMVICFFLFLLILIFRIGSEEVYNILEIWQTIGSSFLACFNIPVFFDLCFLMKNIIVLSLKRLKYVDQRKYYY